LKKQDLRERIKKKRSSLSPDEVRERSKQICMNFLRSDLYKNAKSIAIYLPIKNEADLEMLKKQAFLDKKRVSVPVTDVKTNDIFLSEILEEDEFLSGDFGISEPLVKRKTDIKNIDTVLVPGLAFDKKGGRTGWGKGFYDRLLKDSEAVLIGVGYDFQIFGSVETEAHDRLMNYILTESELVVCG